jgi:hypothetical protein
MVGVLVFAVSVGVGAGVERSLTAQAVYRESGSSTARLKPTPGQGLSVRVRSAGVDISSGSTDIGLSLRAVGFGESLRSVGNIRRTTSGKQVSYAGTGLSEWFRSGPVGVEQGFTVPRAPAGPASRPLTILMALSGDARATLDANRGIVTFGEKGGPRLRYDGLRATDADGRVLRSWLQLRPGRLSIRIDTRGARYPLQVDPLVQQGEPLTGSGGGFGFSVGLSADGDTAVVGDPGAESMWVFTRSGSTWAQQGPTILSPDEGGDFGASIALSSDGNTALIGEPSNDHEQGAAWVYTRAGMTWTLQQELTAGKQETGARFGQSLALSGDGNTALVGGVGATWTFVRSGGIWVRQIDALPASTTSALGAPQGPSLALSYDGDTALVGQASADEGVGAVVPFTRSGTTWVQGSDLTGGSAESGHGLFGSGVSLSSDGDTALIGGAGAAWVFDRTGSSWLQGDEVLTGRIGEHRGAVNTFGCCVALSADGNTALIGSPLDNDLGAAWVFGRSGSTWTQNGPKLTGTGVAEGYSGGLFGASLALSADGATALVGGAADSSGLGAVWVFEVPQPGVVSEGASAVGVGSARLNGMVDAEGVASRAFFQYGPSSAYGQSTPLEGAGSAEGDSPFAADVGGLVAGTTYHFRIVAENAGGRSYGADETFTTGFVAPVNASPPAISGVAIRGLVLLASPGSWSNDPTTIVYQWDRCDAAGTGCVTIAGATSPVYTLGQGDVGHTLRVVVTAGNAAGASAAAAAASAIVGSLVEAVMTWTFAWGRRYTEVRALAVQSVPAGGEIDVACRGRGCPFARDRVASVATPCHASKCPKATHAPGKARTNIAGLFKGRRLGVGARITVSVMRAGWIGKAFVFTTRARKSPSVKIACVGVNSTNPGEGC